MIIKLNISFYRNNTEIAVVYFREGYSPDHYSSQKVRVESLHIHKYRVVMPCVLMRNIDQLHDYEHTFCMIVWTIYFTYSKKTSEFHIVTFFSVFVCGDTIQIDFVMWFTGVYNMHVYVHILSTTCTVCI